jgi:GntR family negative regulator for fad regulon and positive regulator of fabA
MPAKKPTARAETQLIRLILDGVYPPGSALPGERDLAKQLNVARPPLREALQRLAREGWLDISQGRPTRVTDFWREGNLMVLRTIVEMEHPVGAELAPHLVEMWALLAPTYARQAAERHPEAILTVLEESGWLGEDPAAYARFEWRLHRALTDLCGNPVYGLLLNSFGSFYEPLAAVYFRGAATRAEARAFHARLREAVIARDGALVERVVRTSMQRTRHDWASHARTT